jgi:hypothetical protein
MYSPSATAPERRRSKKINISEEKTDFLDVSSICPDKIWPKPMYVPVSG